MKRAEEVMEILEAYDQAGTLRGAAALAGCDHETVAHWVRVRERAGGMPATRRRRPAPGELTEKIDELMDRAHGKIRADVAHEKLVALGYRGSPRTSAGGSRSPSGADDASMGGTRARGSRSRGCGCGGTSATGRWWRAARRCCSARGRRGSATGSWLPLRDETMPSVVIGLGRALRRFGGAPTYTLTGNERTVSVDHVCGIAARNPQIVAVTRHGLTIATCVAADPQSKGGSEATVWIAKADPVPTDRNLRAGYGSFGESEAACEQWIAHVNARPHRATQEPPVIPAGTGARAAASAPDSPARRASGQTRKVSWQSTISVGGALYSAPHQLVDERLGADRW